MIDLKKIEQLIKENKLSFSDQTEKVREDGGYYKEEPCKNYTEAWRPPKRVENENKIKIMIKQSLLNSLVKVHQILYNHCGRVSKYFDENALPMIFLLGSNEETNKYINAATLVDAVYKRGDYKDGHSGGCSAMASIPSAKLNEALYDLMQQGATPVGIARIGVFDSENKYYGSAFHALRAQLKDIDFCFLSIGCWDIEMRIAYKQNGFLFDPCDLGTYRKCKKIKK